jgi:hypothetical protein
MASTVPNAAPPSVPELEATPPEVKRYERQKLTVSVASLLVSLVALVLLTVLAGPWLGRAV